MKQVLKLLLLVPFVLLASCAGPNVPEPARMAVESFVSAYYQNDDIKTALNFTTGKAKDALSAELKEIEKYEGADDKAQSTKPSITTELIGEKKQSDSDYQFTWRIVSDEGEKLVSDINATKSGDQWLVVSFSEHEK